MNNSRTHLNKDFVVDEQNEEDQEKGILERFKNCIKCKKVDSKSKFSFLNFWKFVQTKAKIY